jgi:tRNA G18 (ribose-2'-O)-methylase SpoU
VITSAANSRLKLVRKLRARRQRDKLGLFVCEGEDLVAAALDAGQIGRASCRERV